MFKQKHYTSIMFCMAMTVNSAFRPVTNRHTDIAHSVCGHMGVKYLVPALSTDIYIYTDCPTYRQSGNRLHVTYLVFWLNSNIKIERNGFYTFPPVDSFENKNRWWKLIRAKIQLIFDAASCRQVSLWKKQDSYDSTMRLPERVEKKL